MAIMVKYPKVDRSWVLLLLLLIGEAASRERA
jgi:hypothetical protein